MRSVSLLSAPRVHRARTDVDFDAGHALNKVTKDLINRSKLIQGHRVQCVASRASSRPFPSAAPRLNLPLDAATSPASTRTASRSSSRPSRRSRSPPRASRRKRSAPPRAPRPRRASRSRAASSRRSASWATGRTRTARWIGGTRGGSSRSCATWSTRVRARSRSRPSCSSAQSLMVLRHARRAHRLAPPPDPVLAVVPHGPRRSRARVPRGPRLALGLRLIPRRRARADARARARGGGRRARRG